MRKQKEAVASNTKIAIVFLIFLAVIAGISLIFKIILVVRAGQFDDFGRFTISVSDNRSVKVMSLSPGEKTIAIFKLNKSIEFANAGKFLKVPINGFIVSNSLDMNQNNSAFFLKAILNYNNLQTNLTIIDLLRLSFFARSVKDSEINVREIAQNLSAAEADKIVGRQVSDELMERDSQTIRIINGTDVVGFGNRLARLITNMGGNVIIVATSDSPIKTSEIFYTDKETYTVKKLTKMLKYKSVKESSNAVSDITITIGEDKAGASPF
ncbi:MAG: LytR C-terminal domain-containing protein [Candidatus Levybacteria bacterium]|nr:LytR C-terminal domain-containing protein [Candidatus Levybacteria bacterium]